MRPGGEGVIGTNKDNKPSKKEKNNEQCPHCGLDKQIESEESTKSLKRKMQTRW
jgi:protein-disulfide isomerase